jgi:hypothetical protein
LCQEKSGNPDLKQATALEMKHSFTLINHSAKTFSVGETIWSVSVCKGRFFNSDCGARTFVRKTFSSTLLLLLP